jgi:hypothetical protein
MAIFLSPLAQSKEREDGHDHDNQPDEIDQPIHLRLRQVCLSQLQTQNCRKPKLFLSRVNDFNDAPRNRFLLQARRAASVRYRTHPIEELLGRRLSLSAKSGLGHGFGHFPLPLA